MPSNGGDGAKGVLALLALVGLIVLAMQVTALIDGDWRRNVFVVWLVLAICAGVALLELFRTKRHRRRNRVQKAVFQATLAACRTFGVSPLFSTRGLFGTKF